MFYVRTSKNGVTGNERHDGNVLSLPHEEKDGRTRANSCRCLADKQVRQRLMKSKGFMESVTWRVWNISRKIDEKVRFGNAFPKEYCAKSVCVRLCTNCVMTRTSRSGFESLSRICII